MDRRDKYDGPDRRRREHSTLEEIYETLDGYERRIAELEARTSDDARAAFKESVKDAIYDDINKSVGKSTIRAFFYALGAAGAASLTWLVAVGKIKI